MIQNELVRVSCPSVSQFEMAYERKKTPVILSNAYCCKATKDWNLQYLKNKYSDKVVHLDHYSISSGDQEWSGVDLALDDALDLISTNSDQDKKHHLMQKSMREDFPELLPDLELPKYIKKEKDHIINLWVGESGTISPAHYDFSDNFLTQIMGRKQVKLFSPLDTSNMYPYEIDSQYLERQSATHISKIHDTTNVAYKAHPKFKNVTCYEGIIYPGDLLYIPSGWWHEIKALDVSISVNFWWKKSVFDLSNKQLTDWVCSTFFNFSEDSFNEIVNKYFDLSEYLDDIDLVETAISKNLLCVAAVFLLNYINKNSKTISKTLNESLSVIEKWKDHLSLARKGDDSLINKKLLSEIVLMLRVD